MADKVAVKPSLTIKRRFNAPPEKVYAAWTRPEQIAKWLGGHQIVSATAETDVRAGGRYRLDGPSRLRLRIAPQDPALFELPPGYRKLAGE